jgi:hypothetical protein
VFAQPTAPATQVVPPKLVRFVDAPYPAAHRDSNLEARVILRLTIGLDGRVTEVVDTESRARLASDTSTPEVVPAPAEFIGEARAAASQFVFEPAMQGETPIAVRILYEYVFTPPAPRVTTGRIRGTIIDKETNLPRVGVSVRLDSGATAVTSADGQFVLEGVEPGTRTLFLEGDGIVDLLTEEAVEAGKTTEVTYSIAMEAPPTDPSEPTDDLEIVVMAPAVRKEAVSTTVEATEATRIAGTQGDVLKVVESMPGVGRAAVGSGQLLVWGAAPEDTRAYVDGIPIPRLYHQGGLRSVLHGDLVRSVELVPGAYGPAFGRGLGGIIVVETKDDIPEHIRGSASIDNIEGALSVQAPITERFSIGISGRASYLDRLADPFVAEEVEEVFPFPRYYDAQLRLQGDLGDGESLSATAIVSSDDTRRGVSDPDPSRRVVASQTTDFVRTWIKWSRPLEGGGQLRLSPWAGYDVQSAAERVGFVSTRLDTTTTVAGLRGSWRGAFAEWLSAEVGLDVEVRHVESERVGSLGLPAREGDVRTFGQPPPDEVGADDWTSWIVGTAIYAELDAIFFDDTLRIRPGLRLDPSIRSVSRVTPKEGDTPEIGSFTEHFRAEPRIAIEYTPASWVTVRAATGLYSQPPSATDLSAVFGNPSLPDAAGHHVLAGATFRFLEVLSVDLTGFLSLTDDLAMRSALESPLRAKALVASGVGRAMGGQITVRKESSDGWFGWVSYSIMRSERRDNPDSDWRLFDYDQTHLLTAVGSVELGWGFDIGLRLRLASGFPRTPVVGSYFDTRAGRFQPLFGERNSQRIPLFFQIDARVTKRFEFDWSELELFAEVQNATNSENPEEFLFSTDFRLRGNLRGLPILPVIGLKWSFE